VQHIPLYLTIPEEDTLIEKATFVHNNNMKYLLLSAAPALLAFAYWYAIYPPYFCSGMCCVVKSTCASVPMKENIVQPKYELLLHLLNL
jgi:hypothetical protein